MTPPEESERQARIEENVKSILTRMDEHRDEHKIIAALLQAHDRQITRYSLGQKITGWVGGTILTALIVAVVKLILGG